jgi:hypothetical protein
MYGLQPSSIILKQEQGGFTACLLHTGLLSSPEDSGTMFLWEVMLYLNYTALQTRKRYIQITVSSDEYLPT